MYTLTDVSSQDDIIAYRYKIDEINAIETAVAFLSGFRDIDAISIEKIVLHKAILDVSGNVGMLPLPGDIPDDELIDEIYSKSPESIALYLIVEDKKVLVHIYLTTWVVSFLSNVDDKITLEFVESIRKQEMEDRLKDITM